MVTVGCGGCMASGYSYMLMALSDTVHVTISDQPTDCTCLHVYTLLGTFMLLISSVHAIMLLQIVVWDHVTASYVFMLQPAMALQVDTTSYDIFTCCYKTSLPFKC